MLVYFNDDDLRLLNKSLKKSIKYFKKIDPKLSEAYSFLRYRFNELSIKDYLPSSNIELPKLTYTFGDNV